MSLAVALEMLGKPGPSTPAQASGPAIALAGLEAVPPVPHRNDLLVNKTEVLNYAAWLDARVDETQAAYLLGLQGPALPVLTGSVSPSWVPWLANWKAYRASLEGLFGAVDQWSTIAARHADLNAFRERMRAAGIGTAPLEAPPNTDPPGGPSLDLGSLFDKFTWALVALGAVLLLRGSSSRKGT